MRKIIAVLALALLLPAVPSAAPVASLPPGVTKGPSVEGIDEYSLANGLRVLLFPDSAKPTVTVNVTYLVGSRNENYGETGMAHLLEHLVFKGSAKHKNIPQELTSHGASPNGSTSFDRTNYFETLASTPENLEWALDLEADRMVNSFISRKDLDTEMTVVRNEFESGENKPQRILMERVRAAAYQWHNYGKTIIGARADIENVPIDRLQAFYKTWYQPDNAVLVVAGDFDPAKTLPLINKKFGAIPRPARQIQKTYTADPAQDGERLVTLRRAGDTQEVMAVYHAPASAHADSQALDVLSYILGDTPSGRLYKALVETKKAASAYGFNYSLREGSLLMFGATVRAENSVEEARDALLKTVEGAPESVFTDAEVERARTAMLKSVDLTLRSPDKLGVSLSESIAEGDWRLFFLQRDRLKAVTAADVKRVAGLYLKPSNRTLGVFYPTAKPDRAEIPAAPDAAALVKDYKGGEAVSAGEVFDPSPENIDKRTQRAQLKSGLKLALLPKKTRGSSVQVTLSLNMGSEATLKGRGEVPDLTGSMLMRGTLKHTRQEIEDAFDKLKTRASIGGGYVSLETDRANLVPALRLAAEVLKEPSFPEAEFATLKQETLAAIEQQKSQPDALANVAFQRRIAEYPAEDPRYTPTLDEQAERVKAVTLDDMKAFHKAFYGASSGQLAIVGDFDAKELTALAEELFGGWTSATPFSRLVDNYREVAPGNIVIETPDKANANAFLGQSLKVRDDNPDYPALLMGNFMTGGGFLNSRLAVRIRQKEGLSYGVGSSLYASAQDEKGLFAGYAIFNPLNAGKLEKAFREELDRIAADGFTDAEFGEARAGWLQSRKMSRSQDRTLAAMLSRNEYLGRTMAFQGAQEKAVSALTAKQVQEAFGKYISSSKLTYVIAGDFTGAAKKAADAAAAEPAGEQKPIIEQKPAPEQAPAPAK